MEPTEPVSQRLHYQKRGHTSSNRDEDEQWFMVDVKIYGKTLTINVCPEDFKNSPTRLNEFNRYLQILQLDSEGEWSDEEENDVFEGDQAANPRPALDLSLHGCYEWAVKPFFPLLEEIASRPSDAEPITLQHFFSGESFEASLTAVDESLIPGVIEPKDDMEDVIGDPGILWKTTCPIFHVREVEVLSDNPTYTLVTEPTRVRVKGRQLFFKAFQDPDDTIGAKEVLTLEKIFKARFDLKDPEVRTSRLYGIVEDEKSHIIGLLLYFLQVDGTLYGKVINSESLGSSVKDKWKRQIITTVEALHAAGIIWGDVKASNILIDTDGDAWVTDFGGGYTEGWVDRDKAGTIEGDLQGLRAVIDFIDTGREPCVMDSASPEN